MACTKVHNSVVLPSRLRGSVAQPRLLDNSTQNDLPTPHFTLSDHTLPITDIRCGVGASLTCRILTASVDHSVKVN